MMTTQQEYQQVMLELLPDQGLVSEDTYLWLTDHTTRLIEYTDGYIEVLPMPTWKHQAMLRFLSFLFFSYVQPRGGTAVFAPLRLRLQGRRFREPDLLVLLNAQDSRVQNRYWSWADLVLEIVSPDNPERDLVQKREEYAAAGIPEYWIVNPLDRTITVLALDGERYSEHGIFQPGQHATSALLPGFSVAVAEVFAAQ